MRARSRTLSFRWWCMLKSCVALFALACRCTLVGCSQPFLIGSINSEIRLVLHGADLVNREDSCKSIKVHQREGGGHLKTQRRVAALMDGSHLT